VLPLDDVRVCYHTDADQCECRKPRPGMLLQAAADWQIDLRSSFMIGDRWRDIDAGRAAGCRTILVGGGYAEQAAAGFDIQVRSLREAARYILNREVPDCDRS
jgi:D-glycero-D-manno-heptose 1,7-bisphosphate phosphatase